MSDIRFEWASLKERANARKHGVTFTKARSVFFDENGHVVHDPDHSADADRFIILGLGSPGRTLVVCHRRREAGDVIRIISARRATRAERAQYTARMR
ncbi:MAG: BrnT family toxin [Gammaproteobacteria bacterium]|nr:BrnT family toxin [Gammaproteobacteria bacterium]